jgi:hypothetical protein
VTVVRIYREDPPNFTTSHNQLGLSLSKHIRYRLVAKINGKRRLRTCEALDQISTDYSRELVFLSFFSLLHTYKYIESNLSYK